MAVRTQLLPLEKVSPQTTCSVVFLLQRAAEDQSLQRQVRPWRDQDHSNHAPVSRLRTKGRSRFMVRSKTSMTPKSGSAPLSFLCESDYRARAGERKIIKPSKQWLWRLLGIGVRINLRARLLASCSQHYLLHTWEWHLYFSLSTQDIKSFSLDYLLN